MKNLRVYLLFHEYISEREEVTNKMYLLRKVVILYWVKVKIHNGMDPHLLVWDHEDILLYDQEDQHLMHHQVKTSQVEELGLVF